MNPEGNPEPGLMRRVFVIVTAAGSSSRFGGEKKELQSLGGRSVLDLAVSAFLGLPGLELLVVTAPAGQEETVRASLSEDTRAALAGRLLVVPGGQTRRDSVRRGLEAAAGAAGAPGIGKPLAPMEGAIALVHDGARPWASPGLVARVAGSVEARGSALPVTPLTDTPKELGSDGLVSSHPARASLGAAQTPQGFLFGPLLDAHRKALAEGVDCTDDAELWARYVGPVAWVEGDPANRKITYREDLAATPPAALPFRIGSGWDLHRLEAGRKLWLGGMEIASDKGEVAHSDGDVLLHAIIDALLGAASLGDIGEHFPPQDARWKDADSKYLARHAVALVREAGWEPANLDCTVVLERPKLGPHKAAIRASVARVLGMEEGAVSVKAKTREGVDATGEGRAIEAYATALLARSPARR